MKYMCKYNEIEEYIQIIKGLNVYMKKFNANKDWFEEMLNKAKIKCKILNSFKFDRCKIYKYTSLPASQMDNEINSHLTNKLFKSNYNGGTITYIFNLKIISCSIENSESMFSECRYKVEIDCEIAYLK